MKSPHSGPKLAYFSSSPDKVSVRNISMLLSIIKWQSSLHFLSAKMQMRNAVLGDLDVHRNRRCLFIIFLMLTEIGLVLFTDVSLHDDQSSDYLSIHLPIYLTINITLYLSIYLNTYKFWQ